MMCDDLPDEVWDAIEIMSEGFVKEANARIAKEVLFSLKRYDISKGKLKKSKSGQFVKVNEVVALLDGWFDPV